MKARFFGLLLLAAHAIVLVPVLYCSTRQGDLAVRFGAITIDASGHLRAEGLVLPKGARARARITLDGAEIVVAEGDAGTFSLAPGAPLSSGAHELCVVVLHGGNRERRVCRVVVMGPFAPPGAAATGALRVFLPETLLKGLGPPLEKALRAAIADKVPALTVKTASLSLGITAHGVSVTADLTLGDDTRASAALVLAIDTRGGKLRVTRGRDTVVTLRGGLAEKARGAVAAIGSSIGEWLGGETGRALGRALGHRVAGAAIDGALRLAVDLLVDREVLPAIGAALTPPASIDLGKDLQHAKVALRWAGAPSYAPGRGITIALDFEPSLAGLGDASSAPDRGWLRAPLPPPQAAPGERELVVDVSPSLVNALLHALWKTGRLRTLANRAASLADWDTRLADLMMKPVFMEPLVPPHLEPARGGEIGLDLVVPDFAIDLVPRGEGGAAAPPAAATTRAHVASRLALFFSYDEKTRKIGVDVRPRSLALGCEQGGVLRACFADAIRIAGEELSRPDAALLELVKLPLDALNPLSTPTDVAGVPLRLVAGEVRPSLAAGWLRLSMTARFRSN